MYILMPTGKDDRINIRIAEDIKRDSLIAAEVRRWTLTQLITHLVLEDVETIKAANPEAFKDAMKRIELAPAKAKKQAKTRKIAIQHIKGNEHERLSSRVQSSQPRRAAGSGRKR
jgi:CHASE3 domain sensor protein